MATSYTSGVTITLKDYDDEKTTFSVPSPFLTALNFDAQTTALDALTAALDGIVSGVIHKTSYGNDVHPNVAPPSDVWAQRELKWLVRYTVNDTGEKRTMTIGTADTAVLNPNNKKVAHMGDGGPVDAFVAALEAYAWVDSSFITVNEIVLVGRNI